MNNFYLEVYSGVCGLVLLRLVIIGILSFVRLDIRVVNIKENTMRNHFKLRMKVES